MEIPSSFEATATGTTVGRETSIHQRVVWEQVRFADTITLMVTMD